MSIQEAVLETKEAQIILREIAKLKERNHDYAIQALLLAKDVVLPEDETKLTTAGFKILPSKLDELKNIVYTKKHGGHPEYSQTQALHEAIDLLKQTMSVKDRGNVTRNKEKAKSIIISRSMLKKKAEAINGSEKSADVAAAGKTRGTVKGKRA